MGYLYQRPEELMLHSFVLQFSDDLPKFGHSRVLLRKILKEPAKNKVWLLFFIKTDIEICYLRGTKF